MDLRCLLVASLTLLSAGKACGEVRADYLGDVKPLLKAKCYACHGALKQEGGLRLDTAASAIAGGDSGAAISAGDAEGSLLIERVTSEDESLRMPQEGAALSTEEIEILRYRINGGAAAPEHESTDRDPRDHWAFRRPQRPAIPQVAGDPQENPIDAFLAAERERRGLSPQPPLERSLLLRRVYLDLIGLPPTREELRAFLADDSPDAYERVVRRLLDSPQHGERWARHWMDVWRYSDWYGRRMVPDVWNSAPQIWRWRDWIVHSLNQDRGYDRMIREMLAADEIASEDHSAAAATGYLIRNWYALNPNDWMRNNVEHTGKAFLALTFNCAHCHDHKYDPIAQEDYFRLRAYFEPIAVRQDRVPGEADPGPFQEYDYSVLRKVQRLGMVRIFDKSPDAPTWFYTGGDERNRVTERGSIPPGVPAFLGPAPEIEAIELPPEVWYPGLRPGIQKTVLAERRDAVAASEAELTAAEGDELKVQLAEARLAAAQAELAGVEARIAADEAKHRGAGDPDVLAHIAAQREREAAVKSAEANVLASQQRLAAAEAKPESDADRAGQIEAAAKQLADARAALDKARAAEEENSQIATYSAFSPTYPKTSTGRRKALAEWIASEENPLTARVAVNHIWMRHFHAPLVATVYDFGRNGAAPTHPELLDWLAVEFMESGWSMKRLHYLIVTSQAYRMTSANDGRVRQAVAQSHAAVSDDPENRFLWRMNVGRMEAEVVRDSLLSLAGRMDLTMGGQELENSEALATHRRSLYYSCHPELDGKSQFGALFDAPEASGCYRRTRTVVPQQALALTNSELVHEVSDAIAADVWKTSVKAENPRVQDFVSAAYERILCRPPSAAEMQLCREFLDRQAELIAQSNAADAAARARESLVRALLNHNDFIAIR
ncbi:MAG: DUF1553 domain-containing protein [Planctomycetes bacterium]|nr:DUF1553 domain-containing protein [Planctomycetota bacterium]